MRTLLIWLLNKLNTSVILNVKISGSNIKMLKPNIQIIDNTISGCEFYLKEGKKFDVGEDRVSGNIYPSQPEKDWPKEILSNQKQVLIDKISHILKGIDEEEINTEHGWWETSHGAKFGARKLEAIKSLIADLE